MPPKSKSDPSLNDIICKGYLYNGNTTENTYENEEYVTVIISKYKSYSAQIVYSKYLNKHVMYFYIMDLNTDEKLFLCKIGYSYSIDSRERKLCDDFSCNLFPVGFLEINSESDEKRFHDLIVRKYPNLPYVIEKKKSTKSDEVNKKYEIYKLDPVLFEEFFKYNINLSTNTVLIEQEKTKQEQEKTKQEEEKTKQIVAQEKTKQEQEKTKQMELELEMMKLKLKIDSNV